mmetsp:Transcript_16852/g.45634  ORF Transcript_16852/g.45634 Transcript_16852/m.45634 type:complete len:324 (+) Transcript_16852:810-1781(+)
MQDRMQPGPITLWRQVLEDEVPKQLKFHPDATLGLAVDVKLLLRNFVLENRKSFLFNVVNELRQSSEARMKTKFVVVSLHRFVEHWLVNFEKSSLTDFHGAHGEVEAFVHAGIPEVPADRSLLHLLIEVTHKPRHFARFLIQEVDHVHVLLELVTRLLRLRVRPILLAVVQLLASMRHDLYLASHNCFFPTLFSSQPFVTDPIRPGVRISVAILLDPELPDGAVGCQLCHACSNVTHSLALQSPLVLSELALDLFKHLFSLAVRWIEPHNLLQILLSLLPQSHGEKGLRPSEQSFLVFWLPVKNLISQLFDPIPFLSLDVQLR